MLGKLCSAIIISSHVFGALGGCPEDDWESCTNGIDDNGDGRVDCYDPICAPRRICNGGGPNT